MHIRIPLLLSTCALVSLFALGCDPRGSAGALGGSLRADEKDGGKGEPRARPEPVRPGPDTGVTPTLPPQIDPLHDPQFDPLVQPKAPLGIDTPGAPVPFEPGNAAAKGGGECCRLECGPRNDDGSKDCITICRDC